jgi:hypothetical protein
MVILQGTDHDFDIVVEPAAEVHGTVTDWLGSAVAGASIEIKPTGQGGWWMRDSGLAQAVVSDTEGAFAVDGLVAGGYAVMCKSDAHARSAVEVVLASAEHKQLDFALGRARSISVHVLSTSRVPIEGADVYVEPDEDPLGGMRGATDAAGVARFGQVPLGDVRVHVRADGYVVGPGPEMMHHGEDTVEVLLDTGYFVAGRVEYASGRPAPGVLVQARQVLNLPEGQQVNGLGHALTDERGIFRITGLPQGNASVEATSLSGAPLRGEADVAPAIVAL